MVAALRTVGDASIELASQLKNPTDTVDGQLSGIAHIIRDWPLENRMRCLMRIRMVVQEEVQEYFQENFGYQVRR